MDDDIIGPVAKTEGMACILLHSAQQSVNATDGNSCGAKYREAAEREHF